MTDFISGHADPFARNNLPPEELWPGFLLDHPAYRYPDRMNCAVELLDKAVTEKGWGDRRCLLSPEIDWTYADLLDRVNRIAAVLVEDLGLVSGNRVMLRAANTPMMVACCFAVLKAGGVVVATMPLLRAKELAHIAEKAEIDLALCDARLMEEMTATRALAPRLGRIVRFQTADADGLEAAMASKSGHFRPCDTHRDDVCLIAFTSGTTGQPKGTMHFHRDMMAICDGFSGHVLQPDKDDLFCGSPPLAFTFGLGGLVLFPMRVGAAGLLLEQVAPKHLMAAIQTYRPTVCFTAPTAYKIMAESKGEADLSSLRKCVSAGETLPLPVFQAFQAAYGLKLIDGIGATEMLHIFISAAGDEIRPGTTGKPVPGYEARVIDEAGNETAPGTVGRLAVRGPTGCRYLADERQKTYVSDGWNVTGDAYTMDADGYFTFQARADDMIISSGYNIAGPEVEASLITHPSVAECGVVGAPDPDRGRVVKAYIVLKPGETATDDLTKSIQDFVKADIAPYKYPRVIEYVEALPRTDTGKLQRFKLRHQAEAGV